MSCWILQLGHSAPGQTKIVTPCLIQLKKKIYLALYPPWRRTVVNLSHSYNMGKLTSTLLMSGHFICLNLKHPIVTVVITITFLDVRARLQIVGQSERNMAICALPHCQSKNQILPHECYTGRRVCGGK
ncbi:hypothetical protein XELAEV_18045196mg [Xenopus laevis]|uniref:Uncharacterized protein n=1 Tax=Xenopus laevis TaxID=8355 RepID=A0A974C0K6_XENLA|nr:hypothetical protein XELAEV_18045196mg [Xenopus laevis]